MQLKPQKGDPRLNLAERAFFGGGRNRLWVGDITYIPTREGWLYLAAVTGAFSRTVAGWSMSERITEKVAIDAIEQAVGREGPQMTAASSSMTIKARSTPPVPSSDVWTRMA